MSYRKQYERRMEPTFQPKHVPKCLGLSSIFFADDEHSVTEARKTCYTCKNMMDCRAFAVQERINYGVWGGVNFANAPERRRAKTGR